MKKDKIKIKENRLEKSLHFKLMKRQLKPLRLSVFSSLILSLIEVALSAFIAIYLQDLINKTVAGSNINFYLHIPIALSFIIIWCLVSGISNFLLNLIIIKAMKIMRILFFNKVLCLDISSKYDAGDLITRAFNDCSEIAQFLATWKIGFIASAIQAVVYFGIITYYSWIIALVVLVCYPIYFWACFSITKRIASLDKRLREDIAGVHNTFIEGMRGIKIIKLFSKQKSYLNLYDNKLKTFYKSDVKSHKYQSLLVTLQVLVNTSLPALMVILSIFFVNRGVGNMGIGSVLLIYILVGGLLTPLNAIAGTVEGMQINNKIYERIQPILREQDPDKGTKNIKEIESLDININAYCFDGDDKQILKDFKLRVNKGDRAMIVGESGCGKSSLLKILTKQLTLNSSQGVIKINGFDIDDITTPSLYANIFYQSQEPFLFKGTLKENICFFDEYSDEEFEEVIKLCALESFIQEYGKEREIKQDAQNISGGQLQRICLARVLIRKPKLLLLDEPTNSLDKETAQLFINNLDEYLRKYKVTLICVTHDKSILEIGDKVIEAQAV